MSFIGVICKNKNVNYINQILKKNLKKETIIFLDKDNVGNFKNIKFDVVIILNSNKDIFSKKEIVKFIISKTKYLIINADENINLDLLKDIDLNVITFGFNSKSTITASSIKDESMLLCIQRNILDINNKNIEPPQEIHVEKINNKLSTSTTMGLASLLLIYGKEDIII